MLHKLFRPRRPAPSLRAIPPGQRVYAIGDIHGCRDLLDDLLARIDADSAARPDASVSLIFLGDLVDRGPDSAGVLARLRALAGERPDVHILMGNHEEIFLGALAGDDKALRLFCRVGGRETVLSYGMTANEYEGLDYPALATRLGALVPDIDRRFMASFEPMVIIGDYVFVHAGIRPGVPLTAQRPEDLRWIRSAFLDHRGMHEKVVVHGHTVHDEVTNLPNRIGIDTGAFASGRLTALGLEGDTDWVIQT